VLYSPAAFCHFLLLAQKKVTKEKSSHFNAHAG